MIAKIGRGSNITGALSYNWLKVLADKGKILSTQKIIETPNGSYSVAQLYRSFKPYLIANKRTEKPVIHISLNPDPADKVTDENFKQIAEEYMQRMGYGNQPFVVFKHTDTTRTHIHIVSTCVDRNGRKIPDAYEKLRSMDACRDLERKYNLISATEKQRGQQERFQPVNYAAGDIKSQIASVVRYLPKCYNYTGLGTYNALLSLFNITAEEVTGELHGQAKRGLVYFALDEEGAKTSNPFKSSLFGRQAGREALETHFASGKEKLKDNPAKAVLRNAIEVSLHISAGEAEFKKNLVDQGISTVVRHTDQGRIYGITFIDHESRTVWNGSQLGKDLSANIFNDRWQQESSRMIIDTGNIDKSFQKSETSIATSNTQEGMHDLFQFLNIERTTDTGAEVSGMESSGGFLPESHGEDYEDLIFKQRMKKRKRMKGTV